MAGVFYPAEPHALAADVMALTRAVAPCSRVRALGAMAPHAGYLHSGSLAAKTLAAIEIPDRVVIMAPNHTGQGARISLLPEGAYRLPSGDVAIDTELASAIARHMPAIELDARAHAREHVIEVELPFLRHHNPHVRIVPIVLGPMSCDECVDLGRAIARAQHALAHDVLVLASSDMSHYLSEHEAREIDQRVLEPLLALAPDELDGVVRRDRISMCGVHPATAMLSYCRE